MAENNAKITLENRAKDKTDILLELKEKLGLNKVKSKSTKYKETTKVNDESKTISDEELDVFKDEEQNAYKDEELDLFDDNEEETGDEDLDVFENEEKNETEPKVTIEVGTADEDLDIFD